MATKAELAAELSVNIGPFQRGLHHATEGVKEFSEKAGEAGKEVEKGFLGKDLSTLLGIGGAVAALGIFAEKLKDFVGDAIKDFGKMESATLRMALALHNPVLAAQLAEDAEKNAGVGGTAEERIQAEQTGVTAGLVHDPSAGGDSEDRGSSDLPGERHAAPEEGGADNYRPGSLESTMHDLGNLSVVNQKSIVEMMDAIRAFTVKGGEGKSMNKMINAIPELEPIIQARIKAVGSHQTPEEWGKSHIKSLTDLTGLIHQTATSYTLPGGKDPMGQAKDTVEGEAKEFQAKLAQMNSAIGKDLAPAFKEVLNHFIEDIPKITSILEVAFKALAAGIDTILHPQRLLDVHLPGDYDFDKPHGGRVPAGHVDLTPPKIPAAEHGSFLREMHATESKDTANAMKLVETAIYKWIDSFKGSKDPVYQSADVQ